MAAGGSRRQPTSTGRQPVVVGLRRNRSGAATAFAVAPEIRSGGQRKQRALCVAAAGWGGVSVGAANSSDIVQNSCTTLPVPIASIKRAVGAGGLGNR